MLKSEGIGIHVWTDEGSQPKYLIAIDAHRLLIAKPEASETVEVAEQIRSGASPVSVLKDIDTEQVRFDKLKHIRSDRNTNTIEYTVGRTLDKDKRGSFDIIKEQRDDLFEKLKFLADRGFKYTETQYSKFRAILGPLAVLCFLLVIFFCLFMAAYHLPEDGPVELSHHRHLISQGILIWILDIIGPIGVIVIASPFILTGISMIRKRFKVPPFMMEYRRGK